MCTAESLWTSVLFEGIQPGCRNMSRDRSPHIWPTSCDTQAEAFPQRLKSFGHEEDWGCISSGAGLNSVLEPNLMGEGGESWSMGGRERQGLAQHNKFWDFNCLKICLHIQSATPVVKYHVCLWLLVHLSCLQISKAFKNRMIYLLNIKTVRLPKPHYFKMFCEVQS